MRAAALMVVIVLVSTGAAAQSVPDDPQRRAYVVPYARSATDCLARELLGDPDAVERVKANRVREALSGPFRRCSAEVDAMLAAHDRAYYPGAGEAFFRGPYLADLPRAILRRLQPELDRREREAAQLAVQAVQDAERRRADEIAATLARQEAERQELQRQRAVTERTQADAARTTAQPPAIQGPVGVAARPDAPYAVVTPNRQDAADRPGPPVLLYALVILAGLGGFKLWRARVRRRRMEAARQARIAELLGRYGDQDVVDRIMASEVWLGMTRDMLVDSRGHPDDTGSEITTRREKEIFKYDRIGRNRYRRRVTLEDGLVVGFSDRGA